MNKVFSCAGDCDVKIYQDTGSIHSNYGDVDKVVKRYNDKYVLYLVGEGLGEFHIDFSMDSVNSEICY